MNENTQQLYDKFAQDYQVRKRDTMTNLLECGKILVESKDALGHGVWAEFLMDVRVSESQRTAQRLMAVYKNFRHLLSEDYKDKANAISQLGVSHLLELQKLPDRFKKDIEIVREKDGKENKEMVKVIDEEKLSDFLEQQVDFEGSTKHVRDLPLSEMKKYIKEAQGVYEPDEQDYDQKDEEPEDNVSKKELAGDEEKVKDEKEQEIAIKRERVDEILQNLATFTTLSTQLVNDLQEVDLGFIAAITDKKAVELKKGVKDALSISEAMMVRCNDVKERL